MKRFHAIAGLPRGGTTLFCNILNQNPRFHASSTSCVPQALEAVSHGMSTHDEFKSELAHNQEFAESRLKDMLRGIVEGWYSAVDSSVIFDKSRAWPHNAMLLSALYPEAKLIVVVRDLRSVFASIEKQHRKNPTIDFASNRPDKTLLQRGDSLFSQMGLIGLPLSGIEDMMLRKMDNMIVVQYEALVKNPKVVMGNVYDKLGEEWFEHDFDNVENVATDLDALWGGKFPHDGSGKVTESLIGEWKEFVPLELADAIMQKHSQYNLVFGYQP